MRNAHMSLLLQGGRDDTRKIHEQVQVVISNLRVRISSGRRNAFDINISKKYWCKYKIIFKNFIDSHRNLGLQNLTKYNTRIEMLISRYQTFLITYNNKIHGLNFTSHIRYLFTFLQKRSLKCNQPWVLLSGHSFLEELLRVHRREWPGRWGDGSWDTGGRSTALRRASLPRRGRIRAWNEAGPNGRRSTCCWNPLLLQKIIEFSLKAS